MVVAGKTKSQSSSAGFLLNVSDTQRFHGIHHHDDVEVAVCEGGDMSLLFGHRRHFRKRGMLGVIWAMIPHGAVEVEAGKPRGYSVHLPLAWVLQWQLPDYFLKRILSGELVEDAVQQQPCSDVALMKHWRD